MKSSKTDGIIKLLNQGKSLNEIVDMGYAKGTVYAVQRKWRVNNTRNAAVQTKIESETSTVAQTTNLIDQDIENDPDITLLKKEIRKAELQNRLYELKASFQISGITEAAKELGTQRFHQCVYADRGICTYWLWEKESEIPNGIGEITREDKETWRIKPHPIYCAFCIATLEDTTALLEESINQNPLNDIKKRFECQCGSKGTVSVAVKCTECGKTRWWGWRPKKK